MIRTSQFIYADTFSHNLAISAYFVLRFLIFSYLGDCFWSSSVWPGCRPTRAWQLKEKTLKRRYRSSLFRCLCSCPLWHLKCREFFSKWWSWEMQQLGHSVNVLIPEDVCQEVTLQALKAPSLPPHSWGQQSGRADAALRTRDFYTPKKYWNISTPSLVSCGLSLIVK